MSEDPKLSTAQKRALLDRNISSRTVARKAEQSLADDKEHRVSGERPRVAGEEREKKKLASPRAPASVCVGRQTGR